MKRNESARDIERHNEVRNQASESRKLLVSRNRHVIVKTILGSFTSRKHILISYTNMLHKDSTSRLELNARRDIQINQFDIP